MSEDLVTYCTFTVENHYFGLEVTRVQELIPVLDTRPIPQAPAIIRGLINLRGQIVTAFDLRKALGFPPRETTDQSVNVIACNEDEKISLLVDQIGEVVELSPHQGEAPPETISRSFNRMLESVYRMEDRLLLILNIDKVIAAEPTALVTPGSPTQNLQEACV